MAGLRAYLLLAVTASVAAETTLRGVQPSLALKYQPLDDSFACLDGLKTVPFTRVNDDFCDCFDGSDEPGKHA